MTSPTMISKRALISPRVALISTLRTWFLYRDEALWAFVGGAESDRPLEEIELIEATMAAVTAANAACLRAWAIAERIAKEQEQKASTVMREAISELLASERPHFLLAVEHIAGSF